MDIKGLRNKTRMSQREFAGYFKIPLSTIQNWEQGERKPPEYVVELIKYKIKKERLGMLKTADDYKEVKILQEALNLIDSNSKGANVTDKAYQALYELTDYIEENGRINDDYVKEVKDEIMKVAKHAGYTNIQHDLTSDVNRILEKLED